MAPYFAAGDALGVPMWILQRVWLGTMIAVVGLGRGEADVGPARPARRGGRRRRGAGVRAEPLRGPVRQPRDRDADRLRHVALAHAGGAPGGARPAGVAGAGGLRPAARGERWRRERRGDRLRAARPAGAGGLRAGPRRGGPARGAGLRVEGGCWPRACARPGGWSRCCSRPATAATSCSTPSSRARSGAPPACPSCCGCSASGACTPGWGSVARSPSSGVAGTYLFNPLVIVATFAVPGVRGRQPGAGSPLALRAVLRRARRAVAAGDVHRLSRRHAAAQGPHRGLQPGPVRPVPAHHLQGSAAARAEPGLPAAGPVPRRWPAAGRAWPFRHSPSLQLLAALPLLTGRRAGREAGLRRGARAVEADAVATLSARRGCSRTMVLPGELFGYYRWGDTMDPVRPGDRPGPGGDPGDRPLRRAALEPAPGGGRRPGAAGPPGARAAPAR